MSFGIVTPDEDIVLGRFYPKALESFISSYNNRTTGLNIPVTANQVLTVSHAFGHTDVVAEGALVVVEFQILPDLE